MKRIAWIRLRPVVHFFLGFLFPFTAFAQSPQIDPADIKLASVYISPSIVSSPIALFSRPPRTETRPARVNLYIHTDRSIYQPNETIRFTGYILNRDETLMRRQNTLNIVLIDPVTKEVIEKKRFLIKNGFGKGSLTLPDTLENGKYWFIAYTNALLETGDQPIFRELINVRTGTPSPFRIGETTFLPGEDSIRIKYKINTSYGGLVSGGKFNYILFDSTKEIAKGVKIIDAFGEVVVSVGPKQDSGKYRELAVRITRDDLSKNLIFPVYKENPSAQAEAILAEKTNTGAQVNIIRDSAEHHQQSKVILKIQIRDSAGNPLPGIFSMAVAASKLNPAGHTRSIVQSEASPESCYPEPDISSLKQLAGEMSDYGYVLREDHTIKRPVSMALVGNNFATFKTDSSGTFALPYSAMVTSAGAANYLSIDDKSPEKYKIVMYSRADTFDHQLAAIHYPLGALNDDPSVEPEDLSFHASTIILKKAVVKARIKTEANIPLGEYNSTHCDQDYVCNHNHGGNGLYPSHFLNCPLVDEVAVRQMDKPHDGANYMYASKEAAHSRMFGASLVTYHCMVPSTPTFIKVLDPILDPKPATSPTTNADKYKGKTRELDLQSTVYWNHSIVTDSQGKATITFYTNDLNGNFTCTLQGVSPAGVITAQTTYTVISQQANIATSSTSDSNVGGSN